MCGASFFISSSLFLRRREFHECAFICEGSRLDGLDVLQKILGDRIIRFLKDVDEGGEDVEPNANPDELLHSVAGGDGRGQNTSGLDHVKEVDETHVPLIQTLALVNESFQIIQFIFLKDRLDFGGDVDAQRGLGCRGCGRHSTTVLKGDGCGVSEGESLTPTMTLQEDILRNIVVVRCLRDWMSSEMAKGIVVDAIEAMHMHDLLETVIRMYQDEVRKRLELGAAPGAAPGATPGATLAPS